MPRNDYEYTSGKRTPYNELGSDDEDKLRPQPRKSGHALLFATIGVTLLILTGVGLWVFARSEGKTLSTLFGGGSTAMSPSITQPSTSASTTALPFSTTSKAVSLAVSGTRTVSSPAESSSSSSSTTSSTSTQTLKTTATPEEKTTAAETTTTAAEKPAETPAEVAPSPIVEGTTSSSGSSDEYWTKQYTGVATYFNGASAPLSCGDVYPDTKGVLFAALCHTLYDSVPDNSDPSASNRSPVCGPYVAGRKGLENEWIGEESDSWVIVGGDGKLNCVGTKEVRCHVPRKVVVTYGSATVSGVIIVDRNAATCGLGDIDLSEKAFLGLGDAGGLDAGKLDVTWKWE